MKKCLINSNSTFISNNQPAVVADPGEGSLNFPSFTITPELSAILSFGLFSIFSVWADKLYMAIAQIFAQSITVICTVTNQTLWATFRSSRAISGHLDLRQNFINQCYFVRGCRGNGASQRNTLAVDHHHPLRSFAPFGFSNPKAPFFAGAKLPSIKASSQSSRHCSSRSPKNLRHTFSQTPSSSQRLNLRQHVDALGYRLGKSFHRAPVRRIHKMPSKTCRLSAVGLPTRPVLGLGNNGSIFFHCSSFINRVYFAIGSPPIAYYTKTLKMSSEITC
jgi:hypothetical protein